MKVAWRIVCLLCIVFTAFDLFNFLVRGTIPDAFSVTIWGITFMFSAVIGFIESFSK